MCLLTNKMSKRINNDSNGSAVYMSYEDKLLSHEKSLWERGFSFVGGIDEAGRGCMAGPVVAACVIFTDPGKIPAGLNDSKKLSHNQRMELRARLLAEESVRYAVAEVDANEIDCINILKATWKAMAKAAEALKELQTVLVDGNPVKGLPVPSQNLIKGDSLSASIAAASILAKTHRDLVMVKAAEEFPQYGFEIHKGYCTKMHDEALKKYGPCRLHRMSYAPVQRILFEQGFEQGELF